MAIKKENRSCEWLNSKFDLTEEFAKGSFEKLVEYSNENELNLMRIWKNGDEHQVTQILRLGTAILSYFEKSISEDSKAFAAFKLGELSGHLECLNTLVYETQQLNLAKARFTIAKTQLNQRSNCFKDAYLKDVITEIAIGRGFTTKKDLLKEIPVSTEEMDSILKALHGNCLIHYYEGNGYSLTDLGIILAKHLTKTD